MTKQHITEDGWKSANFSFNLRISEKKHVIAHLVITAILFRVPPFPMTQKYLLVFSTWTKVICSLTAWILEPKEITKFSVEMPCQTFTAAHFCCCLLAGLFAFRFVFGNWKSALLGWDRVTDMAVEEYFTHLPSEIDLAVCFGSLSIWTVKHHPTNFEAFDRMWAESTRFRFHRAHESH